MPMAARGGNLPSCGSRSSKANGEDLSHRDAILFLFNGEASDLDSMTLFFYIYDVNNRVHVFSNGFFFRPDFHVSTTT